MSQFIERLDPQLITIVFIICQIAAVVLLAWSIQLGLSTSPRQQHFVWLAALAAIGIAIPLQWNLPSLQIKMTSTFNAGLDSASAEFAAAKAGAFIAPKIIESDSTFDQGSVDLENRNSRFTVHSAAPASNVPSNRSNASQPHAFSSGTLSTVGIGSSIAMFCKNWKTILVRFYVFIVSLLLMRLIFSCLSLRWLKSQTATCPRTLERYETAIKDVGLSFQPSLKIGDAVATPMAFGVLRPTIAMPKGFESWSETRQRIAFLHELNHVKRQDAIWDLLAGLMSTFYWFHPSVHFAQQQLKRTRETATDAAVLAMNIDPASYASELLEIAVGASRRSMAHAMPMAGEQDLKQRIERVLMPSSNKLEPSTETWLTGFSSALFRLAIAASFVAIISFSVQFTFAAPREKDQTSARISDSSTAQPSQRDTNQEKEVDKQEALSAGAEENQWTFEIVRETTQRQQEVVLNISVKGLDECAKSTFRNSIYTRKIDQAIWENSMVAFTFFENAEGWAGVAEMEDFQIIELNAIEDQFRKKVKDLVQSKLNSKKPDDANPWKFTDEQTAEIAKELIPLELATETLALNVLLPHQQRLVLKQHFSVLGWKTLDSVYGNVALGLSEKQKGEIEEIIGEIEADREKTHQSSLKNKREIEKRLWEMVIAELSEDQQRRLATFRESFLNRLRNRTVSPTTEKYEIDGVDIQVASARQIEQGVLVAEPCRLICSLNGTHVRNVNLYDHSLKGVGLDKLPLVANQNYLLGIELAAEEKIAINSLRDEFLSDIAKFIKSDFEGAKENELVATKDNAAKQILEFAVGAHIKKSFMKLSGECYEVLDETQRQVLLENRLGYELFRKGTGVFESSEFCKQLNIDDAQRSKIQELVDLANDRIANVESLAKKNLKDLDSQAENKISNTVTQDQREILNEIR